MRNLRLMELGWDVQRFWVYQIRDDLDSCINRVKDWVESTTAEHQPKEEVKLMHTEDDSDSSI